MYKIIVVAISIWLSLVSTTIQANSDTGFLGMGGWRPLVTTSTQQDGPC